MFVSAVNGAFVPFGHANKALGKAEKIVKQVMGSEYVLRASIAPNTVGMKITCPGKKGFIHVSSNMGGIDFVSLAQDFATVQKAKQNGLIKVKHVTHINL